MDFLSANVFLRIVCRAIQSYTKLVDSISHSSDVQSDESAAPKTSSLQSNSYFSHQTEVHKQPLVNSDRKFNFVIYGIEEP